MLQMFDKKITKCDSSRSHFWRSDQFTLFFKKYDKCLTTFVSNCDLSQKETKKSMFKTPLTEDLVDSGFFVSPHCQSLCSPAEYILQVYIYILRSICIEHGVYMKFGCD